MIKKKKQKNKQTPSILCCDTKLAHTVSGADGEGGSHLGQHPGDGRGNWPSLGQTRRRGVIAVTWKQSVSTRDTVTE